MAQDSIRRGPFAALLVLFGLFASSGSIAGASPNVRDSLTRPGAARLGIAASTARCCDPALADDAGKRDAHFLPPPRPRIVVEPLFAGPARPVVANASPAPERGAPSPYSARAPPAA